jgi:pimeloyl-ACP methyl ester carboxylesterase
MSVYVLVHAGCIGGWAWSQVARHIRAAGHEVFTPTLTGLGERAHLANPDINLSTHIQDIMGVLECERLSEVILVGSSYGSMVITGVAERAPEKLSRLVYIDTIIPKDNQSWNDLLGPEVSQALLDITNEKGDGWRIPLLPPDPPWILPHPLKTCTEPLEINNPAVIAIPRAFIHCTARRMGGPLAAFWPRVDKFASEVKNQGWWYRTLPTEHAAMLSMPKELSELLLELA